MLTYGSEVWLLDEATRRSLNGANAYMISHITDNNRKYEVSADTTTFNLMEWIRARRHRWIGHILRLPDERIIKQTTVRHIHEYRQDGDLLMDVDVQLRWDDLQTMTQDRDGWRQTVRKLQLSSKGKPW